MIEKRRHSRVPADLTTSETQGEFIYTHKIADISESGMFLENKITSTNVPKTVNRYRFYIKELNKTIDIEGIIAHNLFNKDRDSKRGTGIMFLNPSDDTVETLREYIALKGNNTTH